MSDALRDQLEASLGPAYTLQRELGGGGMSRVFVARDETLGRPVVVKALLPELAAGLSAERFTREIRLAAALQQANIVPVHTAGATAEGLPWYTMPFVEGESLRHRLASGPLPFSEAVSILRDVARALAYAHAQGIVHRDIKPENVLLSSGTAVVTDFGIAKALSVAKTQAPGGPVSAATLTQVGTSLGTPAYMAPEQAAGDDVDARADIYAWGVMAYELLAGRHPFAERTTAQQLIAAHIAQTPRQLRDIVPAVPEPITALAMSCLAKHPVQRPQTTQEIVRALDDLAMPSVSAAPTTAALGTDSRPPTPADATPRRRRRRRRRRVIVTAAALAGVLALSAAAVLTSGLGGGAAADAAAGTHTPHSIAVLPLENVGGDTTMQFFADGMTDELTTTVARLPGVHVASRSATIAAVGIGAADARAAGERLGVAAVLEGRIRRAGDRMRLTAQLTNVANGLALWTETYDREVGDAFAVQDEVARAIAGALRVTFDGSTAAADRSLASRRTASPEAHDLYLRGRYLQAKYTEADLRRSIELFREALARDSTYAAPWAGIADSWGFLADAFIRAREAMPHQREALERAFAIDSGAPELYSARGGYRFYYERDFAAGQRDFEHAVRSGASIPNITWQYAQLLWTLGRRDSAYAYLRQAVERESADPRVLSTATSFSIWAGDTIAALGYCRRSTELHVLEEYCAALSAIAGGDPGPMERRHRAAVDRGGDTSMRARIALATFLARTGHDAEARNLADSIVRAEASGTYLDEFWIAMMYAQLGDVDTALEWLERSLDSNGSGIALLYLLTNDTRLRGDPRIVAFGRRVGLPDPPPYWYPEAGRR